MGFDQCALSWKAQRLEKVKEPPSELLIIGIMTHDVAEGIVRWCDEQLVEQIPMETVADLVQGVFVTNDRATNTASFANVMVAAKVFAKGYHHVPGSIIELEQWAEGILDPDIPKLVGRLDQVTQESDDQGGFIGNTDLKTGWAMEQTDANIFQLHLQGWLLKQSYPNERIKVRNFFIRSGQPTPWYELKSYDLDNARRRAIAIYQRLDSAYKKRAYPATPGAHCGYCPIATRCETVLNLRASGNAVVTLDEAQRAILELHILEAAAKTRKNALKKFVDIYGPVIAERVKPDRGVVEQLEASYRLGKEALTITDYIKLHERLGIEAFAFFGAPLRAVLKKHEDDPRLVGLWSSARGKPTFRIGKLKEDEEE